MKRKSIKVSIIALLCLSVCMALIGFANLNRTAYADEGLKEERNITLSKTAYKISINGERMLFVTAINNYDLAYEVGYIITQNEVAYKIGQDDTCETDKYYNAITSGKKTETASDIFGKGFEQAKLIIWEIEFNEGLTFKAYAKQGIPVEGGLQIPEQEIKVTNAERNNKKHTITFDFADERENQVVELYNGQKIEAPINSVIEGYTCSWENIAEIATESITYTEVKTPKTDTEYTVKHFKQNLEDDNYTEVVEDAQKLTGTTDADTNAQPKSYTGFTAKPISQLKIASDGTTVVEVKYDRNKYNIIWKNGDTILEKDENVPYGTIPTFDGEMPTKTGVATYLAGWDKEIVAVTSDTTYSVVFNVKSAFDYKAVNGTLVANTGYAPYDSEEFAYKFTATEWDLKFSLADSFDGIIENPITIYLKFEKTKDVGQPKIYYGPINNLASIGLTLTEGAWTALEITPTMYNQITALDYIFQVRDDNNISECNLYVSLIPEFTAYDLPAYKSNVTPQVSTSIKYADEGYSYKFNAGDSDFKLFFNAEMLSSMPANTATVVFSIYQANGENYIYDALNCTTINNGFATLQTGKWTNINLTAEQFAELCSATDTESTSKHLRSQRWGSCDYYVSQIYFVPFRSNHTLEISTEQVYGNEASSVKFLASGSDKKLYFGNITLPEGANGIYFYLYHTSASALNFQTQPDNNTLYSLAPSAWNWIYISAEQISAMKNDSGVHVRAGVWDSSVQFYVSEIKFAYGENRVAGYNNSVVIKDSIAGVDADLCVMVRAGAWTGQMSLTEEARIDSADYSAVKVYVLAHNDNTQADSSPIGWNKQAFTNGTLYEKTLTVAEYNYLIGSSQTMLFMYNNNNSSASGMSWTIAFKYVA